MLTIPVSERQYARLRRILKEEFSGLDLRLGVAGFFARLLPSGDVARIRAGVYRAGGASIGPRTLIAGPLHLARAKDARINLRIGTGCFINSHVFLDAAGPITVGDGVSLGHHVVIITSHHGFGPPEFRAGTVHPRSVTIESGAWVAAGVTLLPGVTVGAGAVVAAGAVVTSDVPPNSLFGGVPAKLIRYLPPKE